MKLCWDVFCRVIDNLGDLGVCWRLAADLASRAQHVRLWVDDASALDWMAPRGCVGVEVHAWPDDGECGEPGDVVIEAFGCELPPGVLRRLRARPSAPVWLNLEYLSAEDYVERSHGLRSPVSFGPAAGLDKWFFYPGFTRRTGGLLREPGLMQDRTAFERDPWLAGHATARHTPEIVLSLFCYDTPRLGDLLTTLQAGPPALALVAAGLPQRALAPHLGHPLQIGETVRLGALRLHALPYMAQPQFDRLLWSCELNIVRGEDSFVRAQWAGAPFVWHIYAQDDGAHEAKLDAFLRRYTVGMDAETAAAMTTVWHWWNGMPAPAAPLTGPEALRRLLKWAADDTTCLTGAARRWRQSLLAQDDLTSQLMAFVAGRHADRKSAGGHRAEL
jgi:uncharacterized repeat protein (TIGR03837 family)